MVATQCLERIFKEIPETEWKPTLKKHLNHIQIGCGVTVSVVAAACQSNARGGPCWVVSRTHLEQADLAIVARLQPNSTDVLDYFLLPCTEFRGYSLRIQEHIPRHLDAYRMNNLDQLLDFFSRNNLGG